MALSVLGIYGYFVRKQSRYLRTVCEGACPVGQAHKPVQKGDGALLALLQFPVPLERYMSPPEDNLNLLRQYFRTLVTGVLRHNWCPVLYAVAVAHVNSFIFSQDSTTQVCHGSSRGSATGLRALQSMLLIPCSKH